MFDVTALQVIGVASLVSIVALALVKKSKKKSLNSYLVADVPKDTVVLHQYGAAPYVPSISPFVIKLETYLRVAKIPYLNKYDRKAGPKDKLPWIQYNDQVVADSQLCMEFLNAERNVDLNKRMSPEQSSLAHALRRTVEDSLYWALVSWRLVFDQHSTIYRRMGLPAAIIWYMRRVSRERLWSQGITRHSQDAVLAMMEDDIRAISIALGDRTFLFGEEVGEVTEIDCAVFGQLCQVLWQLPGCPMETVIREKYPNIVRYCERMKSAFWPDWDERLKKPVEIPDIQTTSKTSTK